MGEHWNRQGAPMQVSAGVEGTIGWLLAALGSTGQQANRHKEGGLQQVEQRPGSVELQDSQYS